MFDGNRCEGLDDMDDMGAQWEYLAWDIPPAYFGEVIGELNRTGWQILESVELDKHRQPVTGVGEVGVMYRIHARRQITQDWSWERTRQRWS